MSSKNYDSDFCGSLPLHLINQIQSYGILLVVNKTDFAIVQVSENIESFTGITPQTIVNTGLANYINPTEFNIIKERFTTPIKEKVPQVISFKAGDNTYSFLALIHAKDDLLILELELQQEQKSKASFVEIYQEIKISMSAIQQASTIKEVSSIAAKELKRISGFDKIMIYSFDEEWNGTVIAEEMEPGMDSYLGLRFPASDIPKQARLLYLKNPYRSIPTCHYTPVKLYPIINPITNAFVDLSDCNLRSVPAVHIEYLKNMGVTASMSTAIIKENQLWGLISCHHRNEKYPGYELCSMFELLSQIMSTRILELQNKEHEKVNGNLQQILTKLMEQVYIDENPLIGMMNHPVTILDLLEAEGAAIIYNKRIETIGKVPDRFEVKDLVLWLQNQEAANAYSINNLSNQYDQAFNFANIASGIIVLPISKEKGEFIIGFKPEVIQEVNWGGNPNEATNFEPNKINYHPRNSFKLWQETVKNTSQKWEQAHLQVAEVFRNFIIEYTLRKIYA